MKKRLQLLLLTVLAVGGGRSFGQQPQATATSNLPVVSMSMIVTDPSGQSIDDVQKDELRVSENNLPQTISTFLKADKAVDYGIVIDTSGSVRPIFSTLVAAVRVFLENHKAEDECFIERFISSDKIETVQEFTRDKSELLKPLSSLYIEGGQSAVVDALYVAVQHIAEHSSNPQRRRALIIFTDGEDRQSFYSENQLVQLLRAKDVQVFAIGFTGELESPKARAQEFLKTITRETGGRVFFPTKKMQLSDALSEIFHDLHTQYELTFQSSDPNPDNFHPVKIEFVDSPPRREARVIARPGYYLKPPELDSNKTKKKPKKL